jgi:hypothetical protein
LRLRHGWPGRFLAQLEDGLIHAAQQVPHPGQSQQQTAAMTLRQAFTAKPQGGVWARQGSGEEGRVKIEV